MGFSRKGHSVAKIKHHSLTGRITPELLHHAFRNVRRNRGAAGIDKVSIVMFEANLEQNLLALMRDLGAMGESNLVVERRRGLACRATLLRAAEIYGERFALPSGRVAASFEVLFLHGWAPHDSQPKPLKPGSAARRLADALGTAEHSAGEKVERS